MVRTSGHLRIIRQAWMIYAAYMVVRELNFGIPNIDLPWSCGGTVNPSCFAGHQLVVLFLPTDERQQAVEFDSYQEFAKDLAETDAWFLVIGSAPEGGGERSVPVALDLGGKAWEAFNELARVKLDRAQGAVFLFTRGGAFHRVWPGQGHSRDLVQELLSRG